MIHIRVTHGPDKGEQIRTRKSVVTLGRSPQCDLVLKDKMVSHFHGEFLFTGSRCVYRDLLSRNGSFIARDSRTLWLGPLNPECEVCPDDEIRVGDTTILLEAVFADTLRLTEPDEIQRWGTLDDGEPERPSEDMALARAELEQLHDFLQLPLHDATSVHETKLALCEALQKAFPNTEGIACVDLLPGASVPLHPDMVDLPNAVFSRSTPEPGGECRYSFRILAEAAARANFVFYGSPAAMPSTPSIEAGQMHSCICVPLWRAERISGFLQIYSTAAQAPLTRRDAQLCCLLAGVAALLINRAADAEQRARWRVAAAAGEAISGLSHDAQPILMALGKNMLGVEKAFPQLAGNASWQLVDRDLQFLRGLTHDALRRVRMGRGDLNPQIADIRPVVEEVLEMSRRYFLDESQADRVRLINDCDASAKAWFDASALQQALVNCVKNSIVRLRDDHPRSAPHWGTVRVVTRPDPETPSGNLVVSVCDDAGGISPELLRRLGDPFVSGEGGRGLGLGLYIAADVAARLHGQVLLATSTAPAGGFPAGTVVSFRLPREPNVAAAAAGPRLTVVPHYAEYRATIELHSGETS